MHSNINIEVVFATPQLQKTVKLSIRPECTIQEAIRNSKLSDFFPEYDLFALPVGIFAKRIFAVDDYRFKDGDRLEIYRPLAKSPNQIRLERAKNS